MSRDLEYVDDPFDDRSMRIVDQGFYDEEICKKVFWSCGRRTHQFKDDHEISRWRRIDKQLADGSMSKEWILNRCTFAEKYRMNLSKLMSAILNTAKMEEWAVQNKILEDRTIREDEDEIIHD